MYKQISDILNREQTRQDNTIELIASENYTSQAIMDLCGSIFTNKYADSESSNDSFSSQIPTGFDIKFFQ